jgi:NADPH:quinone reductase-like Zn-dependent oxidoreductase
MALNRQKRWIPARAVSMHENYWDVHHAVAVCGEVGPGDTLLVLGASGACGLAAVDLG